MKNISSPLPTEELYCPWLLLKERDRNGLEGSYRHFSKHLFQYGLSIDADQDFVQGCIQEFLKIHPEYQKSRNCQFDKKNHLRGTEKPNHLIAPQLSEYSEHVKMDLTFGLKLSTFPIRI